MNFDIDPSFLESLKTKTLTQIMTFKDQIESAVQAKLDSVSAQKETARAPMETAKQTVSEIEKYLTQLETIMNSFDNFSTTQKASVELNNLQSSVKQTRIAIAQEMSKLFNTTMPKQQLDDLSNDVKTTMSEMVDDTRAANTALSNMSNLNATSDSIKGAIKDWFGFFEVINMGKRILSGMGNDIRELDKVITEITIVTDMGTMNYGEALVPIAILPNNMVLLSLAFMKCPCYITNKAYLKIRKNSCKIIDFFFHFLL